MSKDAQRIFVSGDIHGEFNPFIWNIITARKITDANVIVAGDVGMGFYKSGYYKDTFDYINKKCSKANVHIWFVRGNHDDPSWFNNTPQEFTEYSHVHLVRDYTVLHLGSHNILCVGGATSVDKKFRTKDIDWWEFENVLPYEKLNCKNIDTVITHCAPIFCPPEYERISWMDDDMDIKAKNERILLGELYFDLIKSGNNISHWIYGHYHNHHISSLDNIFENFTDYDRSLLLMGGTILPRLEEDVKEKDKCLFVGLDMIIRNTCDLYELK